MTSLTPAETIRRERAEIAARDAVLLAATAEPPPPGPAAAAPVPDGPLPLASRFKALAGRLHLRDPLVDEKQVIAAQRDAEGERLAGVALATADALAKERARVGREVVQEELNQLRARDAALAVQLAALTREQTIELLEAKAAKVHASYRAAGEAIAELVVANNAAIAAEVSAGIPAGRRRSVPMQPFDFVGGLPAWPTLAAFKGYPYGEARLSFDTRLKSVPGLIVIDCAPIEARVSAEIAALDQ